jgi:tetratricopeptide (TPR) repeat protein
MNLLRAQILILALVPAISSAVRAEALGLLQRGKALYARGQYEESAARLKEALTQSPPASIQAQITLYLGLDSLALGKEAAARERFTQALTHDPTIALDPDRFKSEIISFFKRVRDGLQGEVLVAGSIGGARVELDGAPLGETPIRRRVPIGLHHVVVRHGSQIHQERILVRPGSTMRVLASFATSGPRTLAEQPASRGELAAPASSRPSRDDRPRRKRVWTWIAAATALATASVGLGLGLSANADYREYRETRDPARFDALEGRLFGKAVAADVLFGVAGAAAIGAVIAFFLEGRPARDPSRVRAIGPGPAVEIGPGLAVSRSF